MAHTRRGFVLLLCLSIISAGSLLASSAPVLTTVTPNPLSVGSFTVTIQGSGFVSGALVYDSFGSNSNIQYSSTFMNSNSITASIYQGSATSSTFCVKNPGSACSNSITVPVTTSSGSGGGGSGGGGGGSSSAPTLTAVTPNPLGVGSDTVTIRGSGFVNGALVYDSSGSNSNIQYSSTFMNVNTITASIYQGSATSSTFCVKNPGTACSNSITVPVSTSGGNGGGGSGGGSGGGGSSSAPTLTLVTPNPLYVGTDTVTIQGSGFVSGALVYDSSGSNSNVQYNSTFMNANSITASIYQGNATSSTFCVKNPGSACSNSITVTVQPNAFNLTVVNGAIAGGGTSGTYTPGTVVTIMANPPPAGEYFQDWTGAALVNPNASPTTITMPSANVVLTANYDVPAPIPFPVTTHPRLWVTPQDVQNLQGRANSGNVTYQGLQGPLNTAIENYEILFFPGAKLTDKNPVPANPYPDPGDAQGYDYYLTEENAFILAFNSLIDPVPANRSAYAQAARNLIMFALNQAALGHATNAPFRDPLFAIYNRGSFAGHEWPLVVDWVYSAVDGNGFPILTAADKATIQTAFLIWANDFQAAGSYRPAGPAQAMNSLSLLPGNQPYRYASNNYFLAHARNLTLMALSIDPQDDPQLNSQLPPSALGNTLRSYILDANGAWLYETFAMMGDPQAVVQALGVPNNPTGAGFGLANGGFPPEGMLYSESYGYLLGQLLALQTAGFNNATYSGPQIQMIGAPVWDRWVTAYLSSITPASQVPPSETYLGNVFQVGGYGDMLRLWVSPDQITPFALLAMLEGEQGQTTHLNSARWWSLNAPPNGAGGLLSRMADFSPITWGVTPDILLFTLLNPATAAPTDPRPAFPTVFYDPGAGQIVAHSDWTPTGTAFTYRASWITINHQDGGSGEFGLYRKGEWLTKEMSNYDNNFHGLDTEWRNSLALQNTCADPSCSTGTPPAFLFSFEDVEYTDGSQWMEGEGSGDPSTISSSGPGYVYIASDLTKLYNRPDNNPSYVLNNVTRATRSIVWLNNDYVVVYDRATSQNTGLFKKFCLSLVNNPTITGNTAVETMPDNQQLFVQTLLPANASYSTFNGAAGLNPIADLELNQYIMTVQDPTNPADTRFLNVLQGADQGAPMSAATYMQSSGNTIFDGTVFSTFAVYFPQSATATFNGATFSAPAAVQTLVVTGLAPNTGYSVTVISGGGSNTVSVSPGGSNATSDGAGVLVLNI